MTLFLREFCAGSHAVSADLIQIIYAELKKVAAGCLRNERPNRTLQPTALVHEAWMRLAGCREIDWKNRAHFFAIAAGLMRHIIVDSARRRRALKRGSGVQSVRPVDISAPAPEGSIEELLAIDECLQRLTRIDERQTKIVELRFYAGLTIEEIAEVTGVSEATVKRELQSAKAWLRREMLRTRESAGSAASSMAAG